MTPSEQLAHWVDAGCELHGLVLDAPRREEVLQVFATLHHLASLVESVPLPPEQEPAPVYQP